MSRVFSGIQPSGDLHLGNYLGALRNWQTLLPGAPAQGLPEGVTPAAAADEAFFCVVDYHALTAPYERSELARRTWDAVRVYVAAGLDPERCTIFVQSHVPRTAELAWILTTVTPIGELERMSQYKDKSARQESVLSGLLQYPILQAADILLYKGEVVPVGEDQVQHIELTREIARKFNHHFAPVFPEPAVKLNRGAERVLGIDGKAKMSKSLNNHIPLLDTEAGTHERVRQMVTDPKKIRRNDPGRPEICNVFTLHGWFTSATDVPTIERDCRSGALGCVDCKQWLARNLNADLAPVRERAAALAEYPARVDEIIASGARTADRVSAAVMDEVYDAVGTLRLD